VRHEETSGAPVLVTGQPQQDVLQPQGMAKKP
jgi:hypothetical protein